MSTITYQALPTHERQRAEREVWQQLTTAAGSESIRLGWAGMSPAYAITRHTSGQLLHSAAGYALSPADLQLLLVLVEYPPGPAERADDVEADEYW
jgi:hypothetical protein